MLKFIIIFILVWPLFVLFKNKKKTNSLKEVVKCFSCEKVIAKDDAIMQNEHYYCSKSCL